MLAQMLGNGRIVWKEQRVVKRCHERVFAR
jgi:hypothetical protein